MCMVFGLHVSAPHARSAGGSQKRTFGCSGTRVTDNRKLPRGSRELNAGPLEPGALSCGAASPTPHTWTWCFIPSGTVTIFCLHSP